MDGNNKEMEHAKELAEQIIDKLGNEVTAENRKRLEDAVIKMQVQGLSPKEAFGFNTHVLEDIYRMGYNFFKSGKYQDALSAFLFLRLIDIADVRYSFGIAACYQYLKDYRLAASNYFICNYMDPLNPLPCFHLYDCFMKTNYPMSALRSLYEALLLAEKNSKYEILKGKILVELEYMKDYLQTNLSEKYDMVPREKSKS